MYFQQWRDQLINQLFPLKYLAKRWKPSLNTIRPQESTLETYVQEPHPSPPVALPDIYESHLPSMHYETFAEVHPEMPAFAEPTHQPFDRTAGMPLMNAAEPLPTTNVVPGLEELIQQESPEMPQDDLPSDFF